MQLTTQKNNSVRRIERELCIMARSAATRGIRRTVNEGVISYQHLQLTEKSTYYYVELLHAGSCCGPVIVGPLLGLPSGRGPSHILSKRTSPCWGF